MEELIFHERSECQYAREFGSSANFLVLFPVAAGMSIGQLVFSKQIQESLQMPKGVALLLGLLMVLPAIGCGGSPEEGDTSHLKNATAEDEAAKARAMYQKAPRQGPPKQ